MDGYLRAGLGSLTAAFLALVCAGCDSKSPAADEPGVVDAKPDVAAPPPTSEPFRTVWDAHYLQGRKVGYGRTTYYHEKLGDRPVVRIVSESVITVLRFGQPFEQKYRDAFWETESGEVLRFETEVNLGNQPQRTIGTVEGDHATLVVRTAEGVRNTLIPWPQRTGGSTAAVESLRRKPMQPGDTRRLISFLPLFNTAATMDLTAASRETVDVDGTSRELLRIDARALTAKNEPLYDLKLWTDEQGEIWRIALDAIQHVIVRTTEARARAADGQAPIDLGESTLVRLDEPFEDAHAKQRARYRVAVADDDATKYFPQSAGQSVHKLDDGTVEITVTAVRPDKPLPAGYVPAPPTDAERRENGVIESDDAEVRKLAAAAVGDETDPWKVAVRCEQYIRARMNDAALGGGFDFSKAFAGAAETARTLRGDCTEHAVLLAAMLRARGIPSRAVMGLVYVPKAQAFGYHLWTEAYVVDRWVPLDATVGAGGTSAAYLKLTDAHLDGVDSLSSFVPLLKIVGRLKIDVLKSE